MYGLPTSTKYGCMGSALILHGCTSLLLNDVYIATQDTLVTDHQTQTFHAFISPTAIQSRFLQVDGRKSVRLALVLGRQPMRLLFVFGPSHRTAAPKNCTWIEPAKVLSTPHITPQATALDYWIKAKSLVRRHNSKTTRCLLSAIYTRFLALWMNASRGERLFGAVFSLCG